MILSSTKADLGMRIKYFYDYLNFFLQLFMRVILHMTSSFILK
jgi:hypothetical protein